MMWVLLDSPRTLADSVAFEKQRREPSMDECGVSYEETYDGDYSVDLGQQQLNLAKLLE